MDMARLPQAVVASAVGHRLQAQGRGRRAVQRLRAGRRGKPPHGVQHHRAGDGARLQRQAAGHLQHVDPRLPRQQQKLDEGAVALGLLEYAVAHGADGGGQAPVPERRAVAQRAGLALQHRQVVPGVANQLVAAKPAGMFGDQLAVGDNAERVGGEARRHHLARPGRRHAVAVAADPRQAGAGDPQHLLGVAVERGGDGPQQRPLLGEAVGHRARRLRGVPPPGQFVAADGEPGVQLGEVGEPEPRRGQPLADVAHLVFHLALFPARRRGAGHRLEQVVVGERQEAPVELAILAG